MLERLSKEIKRRTRVATLFPNEASLLRLVTAVLMETSEEWETEKIYLRMERLTRRQFTERALLSRRFSLTNCCRLMETYCCAFVLELKSRLEYHRQ